jgi:virginiamycin B lyase
VVVASQVNGSGTGKFELLSQNIGLKGAKSYPELKWFTINNWVPQSVYGFQKSRWIRIDPAGSITNFKKPTIQNPWGMTTGADHALWFTSQACDFQTPTCSIGRMTSSGEVSTYESSDIAEPEAITTGKDGALWFTDRGTPQEGPCIGRITTSGQTSRYLLAPPHAAVPYGFAVDITHGPDGALWFTTQYDAIGRITTSGTITYFTGPYIDAFGAGITTGPHHALWFPTGGGIGRITTQGIVSRYPGYSGQDIAAGPDGALWFTTDDSSIGRITTAGSEKLYSKNSLQNTWGIARGPDGAMWFTDRDNTIGRITTRGKITLFGNSEISDSANITDGPDGAMWFTNAGNNTNDLNGSIGRAEPGVRQP